jgi:hypothetical protein
MRLEAQNCCTGEDQQQFNRPTDAELQDNKIWSSVPWDLELRMIDLARANSNLPDRPITNQNILLLSLSNFFADTDIRYVILLIRFMEPV